MNKILIEELERLNTTYPFRVYELETLDGRRIRVSRHFQHLYGQEGADIKVENGAIAYLRYEELKDVIYFVPPWRHPASYIWEHPQYTILPLMFLMLGILFGIGIESCTENAYRQRAAALEMHSK